MVTIHYAQVRPCHTRYAFRAEDDVVRLIKTIIVVLDDAQAFSMDPGRAGLAR
jgi:hypothetical protein